MTGAVGAEVKYAYALWSGNFEAAVEHATSVSDQLTAEGTRGLGGFWHYLAGDATLLLSGESEDTTLVEHQLRLLHKTSNWR